MPRSFGWSYYPPTKCTVPQYLIFELSGRTVGPLSAFSFFDETYESKYQDLIVPHCRNSGIPDPWILWLVCKSSKCFSILWWDSYPKTSNSWTSCSISRSSKCFYIFRWSSQFEIPEPWSSWLIFRSSELFSILPRSLHSRFLNFHDNFARQLPSSTKKKVLYFTAFKDTFHRRIVVSWSTILHIRKHSKRLYPEDKPSDQPVQFDVVSD